MRNTVIFALVGLGIASGVVSAVVYSAPRKPQPPVFSPAPNPFPRGVYTNGIIESYQSHGENTNLYPEVAGVVSRIHVSEGDRVEPGTPLLEIESSVQQATAEQLDSQAEAAKAMLDELRAQPRRETLAVVKAQADLAAANLKTAEDQLEKQTHSFELNPKSVSRDALDNARNAANVARANLAVATRQLELTRAGAWAFDIRNQQKQVEALSRAAAAARATLAKYTLRSAIDGVVLSVATSTGSYISPQGAYDTYTQGLGPVIVLAAGPQPGSGPGYLAVRCFVDEILIPRLPPSAELHAKMFIRGTNISVPLEFVRVQPYVSPKIQLSNARTEKVDVRVLPLVFRFSPPLNVGVYPGQLVDVYLGDKDTVSVYMGAR
ncbi:MAG TPA: biotin/lipoyl-binding protein [Myxococcaceae bacterium]|nr:biotin/lipoyl-binding protein [Myxococcaceae bacterium]